MSTILNRKKLKELEILFSWSQFYENSESLSVSRYPRHYNWENGRKQALMPESDREKHLNTQKQIRDIGGK